MQPLLSPHATPVLTSMFTPLDVVLLAELKGIDSKVRQTEAKVNAMLDSISKLSHSVTEVANQRQTLQTKAALKSTSFGLDLDNQYDSGSTKRRIIARDDSDDERSSSSLRKRGLINKKIDRVAYSSDSD